MVWQFGSGMEHFIPEVWALPAIQSYCLYSCIHIMDPPEPPCTDIGCAWSYHTSDKNLLLSAQGFCWLGYVCLMLEDSASILSDPSGAELSYSGALCRWEKGGSVAPICRNVVAQGTFLG